MLYLSTLYKPHELQQRWETFLAYLTRTWLSFPQCGHLLRLCFFVRSFRG